MPQGEPTHAEMIAAVKRQIERHEALLWTHNLPNATREDDEAAEFERAELERLRAVLAHLERTQWRPIEEAPKDGSWILAMNHAGNWRRVSWGRNRFNEPCWCSVDYWWRDGEFDHWITLDALPPSPETPR